MLCSVVVVVRFLCYVFSCFAICCVVCAVQCSCVSSVWYESGFVPNYRQYGVVICCSVEVPRLCWVLWL